MNLFIDTHLNDIVVVLENNNEIIRKEILKDIKENSKIIMPTIKKVLANDKPYSIIVVNGPGSFTGVRLGVTIAKTLAYTLNIPIRTVTSLECMAICYDNTTKIVGFSDNNGYYVGNFDSNNSPIGEFVYVNNQQFKEYASKVYVETNVELDYLKIIKEVLRKNEVINPHKVNPIYIKKIAVEK